MKQELKQTIEANHNQAMEFVARAQDAQRQGDGSAAGQNFMEAFLLEKAAAEAMIPYPDIEPTRSILLRSAAALALECKRDTEAERLACLGLSGEPPEEIRAELREILLRMWHTVSV